jgi:hypothetical protein
MRLAVARQPEQVDRQGVQLPELEPGLLGGHPAAAPLAGRREIGILVDPTPVPVAIDPGGREVAQPVEPLHGRDVPAVMVQHRIAGPRFV